LQKVRVIHACVWPRPSHPHRGSEAWTELGLGKTAQATEEKPIDLSAVDVKKLNREGRNRVLVEIYKRSRALGVDLYERDKELLLGSPKRPKHPLRRSDRALSRRPVRSHYRPRRQPRPGAPAESGGPVDKSGALAAISGLFPSSASQGSSGGSVDLKGGR